MRPPGHHAEVNEAMGFCFFNTAAIAAKFALKSENINKVLILDWDIHHGNGTQKILYENPNVMYISLHRYDVMTYFPRLGICNYNYIGKDAGET